MKSASNVLDAINELEHEFPVHAWRSGDTHLWPTYRVRLFMNATLAILSSGPAPTRCQRLTDLAGRAIRALWRVQIAGWRDRAMNAHLRPGTCAAFLSDGVSYIKLGDRWFDRVIDPLAMALSERGLGVLKLTPHTEAHVPRLVPSHFVQPEIDRIKLLAGRRVVLTDLPQYDAFMAQARARFGAHAPGREWLMQQAARLEALSRWYFRMLSQSGAENALVSNYYSLEGMAFVQAARRLGARSADLQHGLQGDHHGAYGRWANVPPEGYSTLPDEFWVWSNDEARAIDAWRQLRNTHRPRVIGNLWRNRWFDDADPLVTAFVQQARALRRGHARQALVSLSWGLAEEETDKLIDAATRCDPSIGWWWRLHPVEAHRRSEFAARLARNGLDSSLVRQATDLPLYALVRAADFTLAHSSTVIQEAAVFGVPSIVTSDYGAEIHADLVASGMALHATRRETIAAAVGELARRVPPALSPSSARGTGLHELIDTVLALPRPCGDTPATLSEAMP